MLNLVDANAPTPDGFSLLRLVLVDSLTVGRIVELPLDGGSVLTGRNGRGKTSLLQLMPLFYGESPNKIVTTEAGRDNFVDYYLPRTTSFIAFEYQRQGGHKRMVVVHADKSGERVLYRFVRSGYDVAHFVDEGGDFVKVVDFKKHLQTLGIPCSEKQIDSQTEYRNIVQGVPSSTTDRVHLKYLRELTQDYSFTMTKQPLRQIEKIVSGMFRRKTNFDDLQSMVIDCVSNDLASPAISGDRRKIETWPRDYKAYTTVMALAPRMAQAEQWEIEWQAAEDALAGVRAKFKSLMGHIDRQIDLLTAEKFALEATTEEEKNKHELERDATTRSQLQAKEKESFSDEKAQKIMRDADAYDKRKIQALDARVKNGQRLQDDLSQAEKRREALMGAQSDIDARFERLKQNEKEIFGRFKDEQFTHRQNHTKACDSQVLRLEEDFDLADAVAKKEGLAQRKGLENEVQTAEREHGRCLHGVEHPMPDAKTLALFERKQNELESVRAEKTQAEQLRQSLDDAHRQAMQDFQKQEEAVSLFLRQMQEAEKDLEHQRKQFAPPEGTLLHFLRFEHPSWSSDIAKLIHPDVLDRLDLNPAMGESSPSMFGLCLDLERLDAHPSSDVGVAERLVELADVRFKNAQSLLDKERLALAQIAEGRALAEHNLRVHGLAIQKSNARLQSAQSDVQEAKRQVELSRSNARTVAKEWLGRAESFAEEAKQKLSQFDELARAQSHLLRDTHAQKKRGQQKKRDDDIQSIDALIAVHQNALESKLAAWDAEREGILVAQGVDVSRIKRVDEEIAQINAEMASIRGFNEEVQRWLYWKENEWPKCEGHVADALQHRSDHEKLTQALADLDAEWQKRRQGLQGQSKKLGASLHGLQEHRKLVGARVESMAHDLDVCVPDHDESWTFDALSGQANRFGKESQTLLENIRQAMVDIASGFRRHHGAVPEQYLQTELASLSPAASMEWMAPFKNWFSKSHEDCRRILMMEAGSIAGEVNAFHRSMEEMHLRIQQYNRELQESLDGSLAFESISKIGVEVVSTIKELEYWPAICEMTEAYRAWNGLGSHELPPPEFALTIERLLHHWEVKTGIRADFKNLIRIQGEVTENGNRKVFKRASDLELVSSNGLSYLVLATIFVAFINRIRRHANVNIVWALDELKDLDIGNVVALVELLNKNRITLVCAFPDPDPETMALFKHRFSVEPDRRLAEVRVEMDDAGDAVHANAGEESHV